MFSSEIRFSVRGTLLSRAGLWAAALTALLVTQAADGRAQMFPASATGKTIRSVKIEVKEIFDEDDLNFIYSTANQVKISTREEVVRRELLFKEGDPFDPFILEESERKLRATRYLRKVDIQPVANGNFVDVVVTVQDTWTLIPQMAYSSGDGRQKQAIGLAESNLLGLGKRTELLYEVEDNRESIEAIWEDPRFLNSESRLLAGYFDRTDGERYLLSAGKPMRTLLDKEAWLVRGDMGDVVGRLWENGEERFLYRVERSEFNARYTWADGNPEISLNRFSIGYDYIENTFSQATAEDYDDLDVDPATAPNDPDMLAQNRRYSGPVFAVHHIDPEYISVNYIDRFDRIEDYNLGDEHSLFFFFAPEILGSKEDSLHFSASKSRGYKLSPTSFIRGEVGISTRYSDSFDNSLARFEAKYYNYLGPKYVRDLFVGKHTLAANFQFDYGNDFDRDRELLAGGDNIVRGYEARTFTGDKRVGINLEDRVHLVEDLFKVVSVGTVLFFDVGGATYDSLGRLVSDDLYSDVGFGFRFAFPRSSGGSIIRADIAFPLRDGPDDSGRFELRMIFTGGQLFDARLESEKAGIEKANLAVGVDKF